MKTLTIEITDKIKYMSKNLCDRFGKKVVISSALAIFSLGAISIVSGQPSAATSLSSAEILSQAPDLNPKVLAYAMTAYNNAEKMGLDSQKILTVIDYSLPSNEKRLWVINLKNDKVLYHTLVAHGKGSGMKYATNFSDTSQTDASCLGLYETGDTYYGKHGKSLRLIGLEKGFNDNMLKRAIVMHSAWYVSKKFAKDHGRIGRSWGCPALSETMAPKVINTVKRGTLIFAYYPNKNWLAHSKFLA